MKTIRITLVGLLGVDEVEYSKLVKERRGYALDQHYCVIVSAKVRSNEEDKQTRTPVRSNRNNIHYYKSNTANVSKIAESCESKPLKLYNYAVPKVDVNSGTTSITTSPLQSPSSATFEQCGVGIS